MAWKGNYSQFVKLKAASEASLADRIKTLEKKMQSTAGALQQMKRANKYDKSISAKHKMLERYPARTQSLERSSAKERKPLILKLEATDKASMDVLQIDGGSKRFDGLETDSRQPRFGNP